MPTVHGYHDSRFRSPVFHQTRKQQTQREAGKPQLYLGFELEMEHDGNAIATNGMAFQPALDAAFNGLPGTLSDYVNLEHDGSLHYGVEIVGQPFTLEWYHQTGHEWYKKMFDAIRATHSFKSHDTTTCGLHVHFSRDFIDPRHETRFGFFMYSQRELVEKIARRGPNHYCKVKNVGDQPNKRQVDSHGDRYHWVNFENSKTIEIRAFKGTLKYESFMAALEFVHAVVMFNQTVRLYILADKAKARAHFFAFINGKRQYADLQNFLVNEGYDFSNLPRFNVDSEHEIPERLRRAHETQRQQREAAAQD